MRYDGNLIYSGIMIWNNRCSRSCYITCVQYDGCHLVLRHLSSSSPHPPALPFLDLKVGAPDEVHVALDEGGAAWILKLPSDQM